MLPVGLVIGAYVLKELWEASKGDPNDPSNESESESRLVAEKQQFKSDPKDGLIIEQQQIYHKIVAGLLKECGVRASKGKLSDHQILPFYCVYYQQSISWRQVEALFAKSGTLPSITNLVQEWMDLIKQLRKIKTSIDNVTKAFLHDLASSRFPFINWVAYQAVEQGRQRLTVLLTNAKTLLDTQLNAKDQYAESPKFIETLEFMKENWSELTLFKENEEVSMDKEEIHIQVEPQHGLDYEAICAKVRKTSRAYRFISVVQEQLPKIEIIGGESVHIPTEMIGRHHFHERTEPEERHKLFEKISNLAISRCSQELGKRGSSSS